MTDTVWVKSGLQDKFAERVALFEIDDAHPGGQVFVAGQDSPPREVGRTAQVLNYLHAGRLVEVDGPAELAKWQEDRAEKRRQALIDDAAMFPGGQRGDLANRIAALEAQIAGLQEAPRRGPGRPPMNREG